MAGCGCGSKSGAAGSTTSMFGVKAPNGAVTWWSSKAEQDAAIARTGGTAV